MPPTGANGVKLDELVQHSGEWLRGTGRESDIVISSRVRLARNVASYPFVTRLMDQERSELAGLLRETIEKLAPQLHWTYIDVSALDDLDRQLLVERQLISRELAEAQGPRGVAIDQGEQLSLMILEEDHLRIQVVHSGLELQAAWEQMKRVHALLEEHLTFAFHEQFGYLTACPTNVGTGMRVSVMMHLPALVLTRQIEQLFRSLQKINLAVRGLYGEGSQPVGDFFQISNQVTLGRSEEELLKQVGDVVPTIIQFERKARDFLIKEGYENLLDQVNRAYGILKACRTISSEETLHLLSRVRMGVNMGLIRDVPLGVLNKLIIYTQPAHLQKLQGEELDSAARNVQRARYLRKLLAGEQDELSENN